MIRRRVARALVPAAALASALAGLPACTGPEPGLITETYTIGTFNLAAVGTSASENEGISLMTVPRPAGDLLIRRMRFFVTDAAGRELSLDGDGIHLHHVVMASSKARDAACPDSVYGQLGQHRFSASGNEKSPIVLPAGYAYHAAATHRWSAIWHIMNMAPAARDGVKLAYEVSYIKGVPTEAMRDLTPYYLDVAGCDHSDFDLPGGGAAGTITARSATVTMPRAGRAVYTLGHLHDGGIDVSWLGPDGQARCTAQAYYGAGGGHGDHEGSAQPGISTITVCPQPIDVGAGERWTVSARYPGDRAFKDVMGVIFTYVAE
jgi:hypothetical protein